MDEPDEQSGGSVVPDGNGERLETKTSTDEVTENNRSKHICPFPSCGASVIHLSRHMRQRHKWSEMDARNVVGAFGLRKQREKPGKVDRNFKPMVCPKRGCTRIVKRLENHLRKFHKLHNGTHTYKDYLAKAELYEVVVISSDSENSTSEDVKHARDYESHKKVKDERKEALYNQVYSSSDKGSIQLDYPEIFYPPKEEQPTCSSNYNEEKQLNTHVSLDDIKDDSGTMSQSNFNDDSCMEMEDDGDFVEECDGDDDYDGECSNGSDMVLEQHKALFNRFEEWLKCCDGGRKDERNSSQCSRQVQRVIWYIDNEQPKLSDILDKKTLRDKWLTKFEKERKPGTMKSYLGALKQFFTFLACECQGEVDASAEVLTSLSAQMTQWSKSYHKIAKDRFWEKRIEDMTQLKTPDQVKEFDLSSIAREAVKILARYQDTASDSPPSQTEYTSVRDYLLTLLCINNGSRAGALANMSLGEFKRAEEEDDCFVVKVRRHKTFNTYGPANLVLTSALFNWMQIFISKLRNVVAEGNAADDAPVFLSWNNRPLESSQVGTQIGSCWSKVFGKDAGLGGATSFRKAAVSAVYQDDKSRRDDLAGLMVHHKKTADRYYLLQEKTKAAVKTSKYLSSVMRAKPSKSSNTMKVEASPCEEKLERAGRSDQISPKRRKWLPEEETLLQTLFAKNIEKENITMEEVRNIAKGQSMLKDIEAAKIRNKVRTFFKNEPLDLESLPEETPEERLLRSGLKSCQPTDDDKNIDNDSGGSNYTPSVIPPSTKFSKKSFQKLFDDQENEMFKTKFHSLIHSKMPVVRENMKKEVENDPQMNHDNW